MTLIRFGLSRAARAPSRRHAPVWAVRESRRPRCPEGFLCRVKDLRLGLEGKLIDEEGDCYER